MACIATSVGLGNVWRFPFTAYENGGGAFLIPYIIVLILVGKPFYLLEALMGQFTSESCGKSWYMAPAMKGEETPPPPFSLSLSRSRSFSPDFFRTGIRPGVRRVLRRLVLLRPDGTDLVLSGGKFPVRVTVVDLSPGVAGILHRHKIERQCLDRHTKFRGTVLQVLTLRTREDERKEMFSRDKQNKIIKIVLA